jgi:tripartite-type tricarboxylate transporter receptor subunit TctC
MSWKFIKLGLVIAAALFTISDTRLLLAQESFRGKVIRIVVGLAPGGGFDT